MRLKNPQGGLNTLRRLKFNQELIGTKNNLNRFFTTSHKFIYNPAQGFEPVLKRNGNTVYIGNDINNVSESGGIDTGYDIIEFKKPPRPKDELTADYITFN